jgi:hypothetical protein
MHARVVVRLAGARRRPAGCLPRPCVPFFGVRPLTHSAARNSRFLSLSLSLFSHNIQPGRMQSAKSASRSSKVSVRLERISFARSLTHRALHTYPFFLSSLSVGGGAHSLALLTELRLPGDRRARGNTSELTNSINRKGEKPERRRASGANSSPLASACCALCLQPRGDAQFLFQLFITCDACRVRGGNAPTPASPSAATHRIRVRCRQQ